MDILCSWREGSIVKMLLLPNLICRFNAISINVLARYLVNIDKLILKDKWKGKRLRITNTTLKKNKVREMTLSNFKAYYKVQ